MKKQDIILFIIIIGILLYSISFFGKFVWDDEDFVYANKHITQHQFGKFFTESATDGRGKLSNYYRPVQSSLYSFTHLVFGLNPFIFHVVNVIVHIAAAIAVFLFFYYFSKQTLIPFLISLFFLIHPVQTEAVSYISGISDPLYVFFGFLSVLYFLKHGLQSKLGKNYFLSILFFILCLLSKEIGLVFLGIITLIEIINSRKLKNKIKRLYYLIPYYAISLIYLIFHFSVINKQNTQALWNSIDPAYANSFLVRFLTFINNLYLYISLILFPKDLFMERDFSIQIEKNTFNFYFLGFIFSNLLIITALYIYRSKIKNLKYLIFSYLCFFGSFIPISGIVLVNGFFYEHFLYLPIIFFASFFLFLFEKYLNKNTLIIITIIFVLLAVRNIMRQFDWIDNIRFYKQTLAHAPQSIRMRNGLGMAYAESGDLGSAIKTYNDALKIDTKVPNLYHNLGNAYAALGDFEKAEASYLRAIEVSPGFVFSYNSLLNLYNQTGQKEKAEKLIEKFKSIK